MLSDHKPLQAIAKKPLQSKPKGLQGMLLKLNGKTLELSTNLVPRCTLLTRSENSQGEFERVNAVNLLPLSEIRLEHIK